jgi:hypothetical protein
MVFAVGGNWWLLVAGLSVKISFVISEFTAAKIETVAAFTYNLNSKQRDGRLIVKIHTDLSRFPYLALKKLNQIRRLQCHHVRPRSWCSRTGRYFVARPLALMVYPPVRWFSTLR